jgi:hypothetical protein
MRRIVPSLVVALALVGAASAQQCAVAGPYVNYYGNALLPKINVLSGNFTMGQNTNVRLEAGLGFIEGFACLVVQEDTDNLQFIAQVPGINGDLYLCVLRPFISFFEGQLLGGLNAGNSQIRTFNIPFDPQLCGYRLGLQGYVETEIFTNATFTQYTVGTLH